MVASELLLNQRPGQPEDGDGAAGCRVGCRSGYWWDRGRERSC